VVNRRTADTQYDVTSDPGWGIIAPMSTWAGNLIKLARRDGAMSQRDLALRAGTSQAAIAAYESGKRSPTLDTLARIVRAAGQDLRIRVVPFEDHDEAMAAYEASLSAEARAALERERARLRRQARRERAAV
jgi:transcriptional regulator with XRE-family HTH domain